MDWLPLISKFLTSPNILPGMKSILNLSLRFFPEQNMTPTSITLKSNKKRSKTKSSICFLFPTLNPSAPTSTTFCTIVLILLKKRWLCHAKLAKLDRSTRQTLTCQQHSLKQWIEAWLPVTKSTNTFSKNKDLAGQLDTPELRKYLKTNKIVHTPYLLELKFLNLKAMFPQRFWMHSSQASWYLGQWTRHCFSQISTDLWSLVQECSAAQTLSLTLVSRANLTIPEYTHSRLVQGFKMRKEYIQTN